MKASGSNSLVCDYLTWERGSMKGQIQQAKIKQFHQNKYANSCGSVVSLECCKIKYQEWNIHSLRLDFFMGSSLELSPMIQNFIWTWEKHKCITKYEHMGQKEWHVQTLNVRFFFYLQQLTILLVSLNGKKDIIQLLSLEMPTRFIRAPRYFWSLANSLN